MLEHVLDLLVHVAPQQHERDVHGAGPLAFPAFRAAPGQMGNMDHLEHHVLGRGVLLAEPQRVAAGRDAIVAADAHRAGVAAGIAADAAAHGLLPEGELLGLGLRLELVLAGQARGRGRSMWRADEHVGYDGVGRGADAALVGPHIRQLERRGLTGDGDFEVIAAHGHGLHEARIGGQRRADLALTDHAIAAQAENDDLFAVDEFFIQKLDHAAAVAALDHHSDFLALVPGQVRGQIMHGQGADQEPIEIRLGANEERRGVELVIALLPADDALQIAQVALDGCLQIIQLGHMSSCIDFESIRDTGIPAPGWPARPTCSSPPRTPG